MHKTKLMTVTGVLALLGACSTVEPGFANHPGDCALGIPRADCLSGTRGYSNGGGSLHRQEAADAGKAEHDRLAAAFDALNKQCATDMAISELDPIRDKIEFATKLDVPPPFQYASLDVFPTASERPLIAQWATLRDACVARERQVNVAPPNATPLVESSVQQEIALGTEAEKR